MEAGRGRNLRRAAGAAGLLLIAALLRAAPMTQSIWYDEAYRTRLVIGGPGAEDLLLHDAHNPLYNAFMWVWVRALGDAEWVIRMPSLLAGLGVVAIVWRWAGRRWGRGAADFAAAFLLLAPVHVWYSCQAKSSMFVVLFSLVAVVALARLVERPTRAGVLWAGVAGAIAVWTDWQALLVLVPAWATAGVCSVRPAPGDGAASSLPREAPIPCDATVPPIAAVVLAVGVTMLLSLPLVVFKAREFASLSRDYLGYFAPHRALWMLSVWLPTGGRLLNRLRMDWFVEAVVLGVLFVPPLLLGVRRLAATRAGVLAAVGLFAPMALMWAGSEWLVATRAASRMYQPRNLIVMLPLYAVVLGAGVMAIRRGWPRCVCVGAVLGITLASSVLSLTVNGSEISPPDWRAAARVIEGTPSGGVRVGVVSRTPLLPFRYYAPGLGVAEIPPDTDLTAELRCVMREHAWDEVWLIANPFWNPMKQAELERLPAAFTVERVDVHDLTLLRLRPGR